MSQNQQGTTRNIACLLMPGFSMLAFSSAVEPLLACNRIAGELRYQLQTYGLTREVVSDSKVTLTVDHLLQQRNNEAHDGVLMCGGAPANYPDDSLFSVWLDSHKSRSAWIAGIGTGSYCLARSGLLTQHKASVHWWSLNALRKQFQNIYFSTDLFSLDGKFATCRSGTSALDMMFVLIGREQGSDMIDALSQYFVRERVGVSGEAIERKILESALKQDQPKLAEAIALMESNIEEPLTTDDIAYHVQLSRRQLERLFKKYLEIVPSRYYLHVRLESARHHLQSGRAAMLDIAAACGFASAAHFSTAYRNLYGLTPSEERALALKAGS